MYSKNRCKSIVSTVAVLFPTLLLAGTLSAAEVPSNSQLEKITIAYSSVSGHMAPLWITHDRCFSRKYGLDCATRFY